MENAQTHSNLTLEQWHEKLSSHPFYAHLNNPRALNVFMSYHVFAVWDFMSLLKSLQRHLTCVEIPWRPSAHSKKLTRLINEIVLGEESDLDQNGEPTDHFSLYLKAMKEVGADLAPIEKLLRDFDTSSLPPAAQEFVDFNLSLAKNGGVHEVASAFFFGREKLVPGMFEGIVGHLRESNISVDHLVYYLDRHIELDGGEHSHLASECLEILCANDPIKHQEALKVGLHSLELRHKLWDAAFQDYLL